MLFLLHRLYRWYDRTVSRRSWVHTLPPSAIREDRKQQKPSVKAVGSLSALRTLDLPDASIGRYNYSSVLSNEKTGEYQNKGTGFQRQDGLKIACSLHMCCMHGSNGGKAIKGGQSKKLGEQPIPVP
jgi:hypothetical protein